jgi:hypothetical protein
MPHSHPPATPFAPAPTMILISGRETDDVIDEYHQYFASSNIDEFYADYLI